MKSLENTCKILPGAKQEFIYSSKSINILHYWNLKESSDTPAGTNKQGFI